MRLIRTLLLVITFICFTSCKKEVVQMGIVISKEKKIPQKEVVKKQLKLHQLEGKWYFEKKTFSGYALVHDTEGNTIERIGFFEGMKEGEAKKWFSDGTLRRQSFYKQNRLDGITKIWWETGAIASESNYVVGVKHGIQKKWYPNGQLSKKRQLSQGQEEGLQQAWLKNGKIYVNYEAKNGRVFGLRRANLCYQLKDEEITTKN